MYFFKQLPHPTASMTGVPMLRSTPLNCTAFDRAPALPERLVWLRSYRLMKKSSRA
jgi:hypothetical protein